MTWDLALSVRELEKSFGRKRALDGVGFDVARGEIVGFLGPNGAGKTTVMKIALGLLRPDAGKVWLFGKEGGSSRRDIRMRIGYLQEKPPIYPEMTARAYLTFFAQVYKVPDPARRVGEVLDRVGLNHAADRVLAGFSRGMQQRTCLARVILHAPEFLILDEPMLGLDPVGIAEMRGIFRQMQEAGATLLFSSHQLAEMEQISDRLVFVSDGRVIAEGAKESLLPSSTHDGALMAEIAESAEAAVRALGDHAEVADVTKVGVGRLRVVVNPAGSAPAISDSRVRLSRLLTENGFTVLSVGNAVLSLEDLFLSLTQTKKPERACDDRLDGEPKMGRNQWSSDIGANAAS
ncbi:ABC transporter ATP-binding protein [Amorphus orientalis]|uniref:ABC-2 type transport system ATP-binding protein n=1 Tax=Amorphus orientalis TaxID=649198 RepID=A0AAE4AT99_9HYPH|nr:ABC transporter ATP-binding protein [Amorphus orientalis]MDQ0315900.1 ABC-2 type transport system ATP-binding protein [Amorphus orientalis]